MSSSSMLDYANTVQGLPGFIMNSHDPGDLQVAQRIADAVQRSGGVVLQEFLVLPIWRRLCELSTNFHPDSRVVVTKAPPPEWPTLRSGHLVVFDHFSHRFARAFCDHQARNPHYRHGSTRLDWDFYIPYGTESYEREQVFRSIEAFGLTSRARFSRPSSHLRITPLFPEQEMDVNIIPRTLEQESTVITTQQRFDHDNNFLRVREFMIQCHCAIVLDNFCFNDDYSGHLAEKILYPIAAGIPWLYAGNKHQRQTLLQRGFRPHLPLAETGQELIHQMLWLKSVFQDDSMARRWQQSQGEVIIHNQDRLRSLRYQIESEARF